jgi:Uma2 family endonuclease
LDRIFTAPIGVRLPTQPVPFEPDIVFVSNARKEIIGEKYIEGAPDLLVEILSPSNWPYDRQTKFEVYREAGVPEYWIVDYRKKTIEVFVLDGGEYVLQKGILGMGELAESHTMAGFQIPVAEVFRDL